MVGGFQRPLVDPNWIHSAEGMQCLSGHWTVLSQWAGTPRQLCHALTTGVQLHSAPVPQLLCTNTTTGPAQHTSLSAATLQKHKAKDHPVHCKWTKWPGWQQRAISNPAPSGTESSPRPSGSVSCSSLPQLWMAGKSFFFLSTVKPSPSLKLCFFISLLYYSNY